MLKKPRSKMNANNRQEEKHTQTTEKSVSIKKHARYFWRATKRNLHPQHAKPITLTSGTVQEKGNARRAYGNAVSQNLGQPVSMRNRTIYVRPAKPLAPKVTLDQIATDTLAVREILRRLVKPEVVDRWLNKRLPLLNQRTPAQVIRRGEVQKVIEMLARLEEGIHF